MLRAVDGDTPSLPKFNPSPHGRARMLRAADGDTPSLPRP